MAQKYLFIVEHFVPAPHSDGGLWNVIADSSDECFDLITEQDQELNVQYYPKLKENILKAQMFTLSNVNESYVAEAFIV